MTSTANGPTEDPTTAGQPRLPATARLAKKTLEALPEEGPARISRTFAHVLDDLVKIPGTKFGFGLDPLLSFIPGAGTVIAGGFGSVILFDAIRLRTPLPVLFRMLGNYLINWFLGLIPLVGPVFDALWMSNQMNYKLLLRTIEDRDQVRRASIWYWVAALVLVLGTVALLMAIPIVIVGMLIG